jgi:hypothetical protein
MINLHYFSPHGYFVLIHHHFNHHYHHNLNHLLHLEKNTINQQFLLYFFWA